MASPTSTVGTAVYIGEESTWGTAVTRNRFFEAVMAGISYDQPVVDVPVLTNAADTSFNATAVFQGLANVKGSFKVPANYSGMGMLLKHAFWRTPSTTGPSGADYTHTFTLQRARPTGGLTIEWVVGASGVTRVAEGCRITSMLIEGKAGEPVYFTFEFIAQTVSAGTPTSATYTRRRPRPRWSPPTSRFTATMRAL